MDRARDADRLWFASGEAFVREPWIFDPDQVRTRSLSDLADVLRTHGVSQRHGPDAAAWRIIAETLADPVATPAVRGAIIEGKGDAEKIFAEVQLSSALERICFRCYGDRRSE
jgi:hypothetical protein